jgi:hypothetical protein
VAVGPFVIVEASQSLDDGAKSGSPPGAMYLGHSGATTFIENEDEDGCESGVVSSSWLLDSDSWLPSRQPINPS